MEHTRRDRAGADKGYPMESNRNTGMVLYSRAMDVPPLAVSRQMDVRDMEIEIHCIETEAYSAVLRAFIAQSEVLSWGKEGLMTDLRKELRVSDNEHREILAKVNKDESVKRIREWRKGAPATFVPSSVGPTSCKRLRTLHETTPISPNYLLPAQPSPAIIPSPMAMHTRDSQWGGEGAAFPSKAIAEQSIKTVYDNRQESIGGKGSRQTIVHSTKAHQPSGTMNHEKRSHVIKIRATHEVINEVEKVISGGERTNNKDVARAKLMLKEHEQAILEALDKVAEILDDGPDSSSGHPQPRNPSDRQQSNGHQIVMQQPYKGRFPAINYAGR